MVRVSRGSIMDSQGMTLVAANTSIAVKASIDVASNILRWEELQKIIENCWELWK